MSGTSVEGRSFVHFRCVIINHVTSRNGRRESIVRVERTAEKNQNTSNKCESFLRVDER